MIILNLIRISSLNSVKNKSYSISEAIKVSAELIGKGLLPNYVFIALIADGFSFNQAKKIIDWAKEKSLKFEDIEFSI